MNIVVCGGKLEADYVLSAFAQKGNHIVVINDDEDTTVQIGEHYGIDVLKMDPTKIYSFEVADVNNFDMVVSLMEKDADNFVVCKIAKESFNIKKAICTVNNPNNVSIFERLGVDVAISSSYLLKQKVQGESDVDSVIRTLSLENERISIMEVNIKENNPFIGKTIAQLRLPDTGNITCIFRDPDVIIPRGNVIIEENDTVVITSSPDNQKYLIDYIKNGPDEELRKKREEEAALSARKAAEDAEIRRLNEEEKFNKAVLDAKNEYAAQQEAIRQEKEEEEAQRRKEEEEAAKKAAEEKAAADAEAKEREIAEARTEASEETKENLTKDYEDKISVLKSNHQAVIDQLKKDHEEQVHDLESQIRALEAEKQKLIDDSKKATQLQLFDDGSEEEKSKAAPKKSSKKKTAE